MDKKQTSKTRKATAANRKASGSAPLRLIRLVVQLNDTKHNRAVLDELQDAATRCAVETPYASIIREDVAILRMLTANPSPNEKVSDGGPLTHESKQDANPPFAAPLG